MKILNFGSLNIDNVYRVPHIVRPGETLSASSNTIFAGGKGLNQSIAIARAGAEIFHAGMIGKDGLFLKELLESNGVNCSFLKISDSIPSGNALIQVADDGENSIVLFGGANQSVSAEYAAEVLENFGENDIIVLQNEISSISEIIRIAAERKIRIFFNPAPMNSNVLTFPLDKADTLIVNETEMEELQKNDFDISSCNLLLTMGAKGASYRPKNGGKEIFVPANKVGKVVDTTGAGDTFIGYFVAGLAKDLDIEKSLKNAAKAAGISITRPGAAVSIPHFSEL